MSRERYRNMLTSHAADHEPNRGSDNDCIKRYPSHDSNDGINRADHCEDLILFFS